MTRRIPKNLLDQLVEHIERHSEGVVVNYPIRSESETRCDLSRPERSRANRQQKTTASADPYSTGSQWVTCQ